MIKQMIKRINPDVILYLGIGFIVGLLLGSFLYQPAQAEEPKHIGIEWSEICWLLINGGDLETCGNPDEIKQAYLQAPLKPNFQKMFDDMAKNDKAEYQKRNIFNNHLKSCVKENYCNVFESRSSVYYWYDITQETRGYLDKVITINANMKHTNLNTQNDEVFVFTDSRALILDTNQINIRSCHKIAYAPEPYRMFMEMGSIMWHIQDNCKDNGKLGLLNTPYMEELELTVIPIDDSPAWLELQRMEGLKAKYKEYKIGSD